MITKGEWELNSCGDIVVKNSTGQTRICSIIEHAPRYIEMDKSNAHIIMAAPALLAACEGLLTAHSEALELDRDGKDIEGFEYTAWIKAKAVIQAAKS